MAETLQVVHPWTGEVALEVPIDGPEVVEAKVKRARQAWKAWRTTTLEERTALVQRFLDVVAAEREELARSVSLQMGKPVAEARGEVGRLVERARMMLAIAPEALRDEHVPIGDGLRRVIVREPLGVVLDIAAWNYPLIIAGNVVVPALLAGNTVLLKHASQTPGVGLWFEEAFRKAGAPEGVVTAVTVRGRDAAALIQHPDVAAVFFTGSVEGGRDVYRKVAQRPEGFIDAGLELGGKDPAWVRADMPLEIAVPNLVEGAFYNAGQSCCGVERIYVDRAIYDDFVRAFVEEARRWQVGDPLAPDTMMGPVASPGTLDTLEAQIRDAVARGGRLLLGGERLPGPGWRFPATVVAEANHEMALMRDESFGPVIGLMPVDGDEQAIALMNDTVYGLTASIWTADLARGEALARRVVAGTVFVNRCDYVDPALPWTGFGDSGKGVTLSRLGFDHLTHPRGLHLRDVRMMR